MPYDIYAIRSGEFDSSQYFEPFMAWKYNPATGEWDWLVVDAVGFDWSGIIPMLPTYSSFDGHDADADIGRQHEGPVMLGSRMMIPAFLFANETAAAGDEFYGWMWWDRSSGTHGEVKFGPHSGSAGASLFPMIFSVVDDPNNAGQYYVSGGFSMVAHWDGTSDTFTGWDEADLTKNWANMVSDTLPSLHGQAAIGQMSVPSQPHFGEIFSTYMFRWDSRFYFVPYEGARLNFQVGGTNSSMRAMLLYSHDSDNLTPDTNADLTVVKAFYPEDPAGWGTSGDLVHPNLAGLKPVYYDGHWWLHQRARSHASGGPLGANHQVDLTFAWVLDGTSGSEVFHDAVDMTIWSASPDFQPRSESLGLYLHEDTNTLYALYCSATSAYAQPTLRILRLDSYDLTTPSFTWTDFASVPCDPGWSVDIAHAPMITSDETHMLVSFTSTDNSIYRIDLSDGSYDMWRDVTYQEYFSGSALAMRFPSAPSLTFAFGTIIGV